MNEIEIKYNTNGQLQYEMSKLNGEFHGIQKKYHDNGKIDKEWNYTNGVQNGIQRGWYENSNLYEIRLEIDGRTHGIEQKWHRVGLRGILICWRKGIPNGPKIIFKYYFKKYGNRDRKRISRKWPTHV